MPDKTYAKVVLNGTTYMDLTGDTVTPETMVSGIIAHDRSGASITGTFDTSVFVTTNTDQTITGEKTFSGTKRVKFNQGTSNDKLGFTLYTNTNLEQGYLEYNPTNKIDNAPLFTLGNYASSANGVTQVGFRRYSSVNNASGAYNLLTPLIADARTPFNLTTSSYTNFYLPLGFTDGQNTVLTAKSGLVNLSTILPTGTPSISSGDADKVLKVNSDETATEWDTLSYDSLTDKPTIPTALSQLTDDSTHRLVTDTEKNKWDIPKNIISYSYNGLNYIENGYIEQSIDTSTTFKPYRITYIVDNISSLGIGKISYTQVTKFYLTLQYKCTLNTAQKLRATITIGSPTTPNVIQASSVKTFSAQTSWTNFATTLIYNAETNKSYNSCNKLYITLDDEDSGILQVRNVKVEQQNYLDSTSFTTPYSLTYNEQQLYTPLYVGVNSTLLTENTNLNTLREPGLYICESDTIAATLTNAPTQHAFWMEMSEYSFKNTKPSDNKYKYFQKITEYYNRNPKVYKRILEYNFNTASSIAGYWYTDTIENDSNSTYLLKTGGTMSGDLNFGTTGKISETELKINNVDMLKYINGMTYVFATEVPANANLNTATYAKVGQYYCASNANSQSQSNCPTQYAYKMWVENPAGSVTELTGNWQSRNRYITDCVGRTWIQNIQTNGQGITSWNAWQKINTTPASIIDLSTQYTFSNTSYANVLQQAISATGWYAIEGSVAYTASMPTCVAIIRETSSGYSVVFSRTDSGNDNLGYTVVANLRASCISYLESGEKVILRAKCGSSGKNLCTLKIIPLNY